MAPGRTDWKQSGTQENEASWESLSEGHIGADEAYFPERTIVTRGPAGSCAISMKDVVAEAKDDYQQAIDDSLDCLVRDVTRNV